MHYGHVSLHVLLTFESFRTFTTLEKNFFFMNPHMVVKMITAIKWQCTNVTFNGHLPFMHSVHVPLQKLFMVVRLCTFGHVTFERIFAFRNIFHKKVDSRYMSFQGSFKAKRLRTFWTFEMFCIAHCVTVHAIVVFFFERFVTFKLSIFAIWFHFCRLSHSLYSCGLSQATTVMSNKRSHSYRKIF